MIANKALQAAGWIICILTERRAENREKLPAFRGSFRFAVFYSLETPDLFWLSSRMAAQWQTPILRQPTCHKLACALGVDFRLRLS